MKKGFVAVGLIVVGIIIMVSIAIFSSGINPEKNNIDSFEKAKKEFQSGNYNIIVNLSKDYYTNPGFYPNYNSNERNETRKAIYGYGAYPSEVTYSADNVSVNQNMDVYMLMFSSTGVYSYQGIGLSVSSPDGQLFETHIEPNNILLSPKYLGNSSNITADWVYKLKLTVVAKKSIPKGEYVFSLKAGNPSPEKDLEYSKVSGMYISGSPIQPSKLFDFVLKIN